MEPEPIDVDATLAPWPIDGPYTPDALAAAGRAVYELVRYANHATLRRDSRALDQVAMVWSAINSLSSAAAGIDQLCQQLGQWSSRLVVDDALRHDVDRAPGSAAAVEAAALASGQLEQAGRVAGDLCHALQMASGPLGHLYLDRDAVAG